MNQEVFSVLVVILVLATLILGLGLLKLRIPLEPEISRKIVHISMGSIAVAFPWIFASALSVAFLAALAVLALAGLRFIPALNGVLREIDRESYGEFYFPLGIAFAFFFSKADPSLYCPPILMLTFGDSLAALVGKPLGRNFFTTHEGAKSWEGSLAFLVAAFITTLVALILFSPFPLGKVVLIAILFSLIGFMIESISCQGLDNLYIPVFGVLAMAAFHALGVAELFFRIVALCAFLLIALAFNKYSTMNGSALIGTALFLYVIWALAGWIWAISPFCLFLLFPFVVKFDYHKFKDFQSVSSLLFINLVAFWWLTQSFHFEQSGIYFWPFTASYALHLTMIWTKRAKLQERARIHLLAMALFPALSTLTIQGISVLVSKEGSLQGNTPVLLFCTVLTCALAAGLVMVVKRFDTIHGLSQKEWIFRTVLSLTGSTLIYLLASVENPGAYIPFINS